MEPGAAHPGGAALLPGLPGHGELIDHLLASHALVTAVETVTTGEIEVPFITEEPREQRDQPGSDHRPLMATFKV